MLDRPPGRLHASMFGLPLLTAWMVGEDPATPYDYTNPWKCPGALCLKAMGYHDVEIIPGKATFADGDRWGDAYIPPEVDFVLCGMPRTYGAAVDRARALVHS